MKARKIIFFDATLTPKVSTFSFENGLRLGQKP